VELVETLEEHYSANNRMHLTQEQVRDLLPFLQKFAETGEL
jgi:Holliday junction resolvase